jgi:hypothetical protein
MSELLDVITALGTTAFWLGIAFGLVELTGILAFWRWAFRLGRRRGHTQARLERPPTPGQSGTTHFAAFKVLDNGTCLFRRKTGFMQTALEWKGILEWRGDHAEVTAVQPFGPTLAGLGLVVAWSAYGLNLAVRGDYVVGLSVMLIVVVVTALSLKEVARAWRTRFDRYVDEVGKALSEHAAVA